MNTISGPLWAGRNWAAAAGAGSIHDDATASKLGFRGGTVPGDVHMNQFPATLVEVFGDRWFECGHLSLNFKNATVDGERVQVFVKTQDDPSPELAEVWMEREDGLLICEGSAGINCAAESYLQKRDLRPCDPSSLKILRRLNNGTSLGEYDVTVSAKKQLEAYREGTLSHPLAIFHQPGRWGGIVAAPSTLVQLLWGVPMAGLRPLIGSAVGLFGAIEVAQLNGPMLLEQACQVSSSVVCVGQSPQTEYLWFDSIATHDDTPIASMRMQLRFMKASAEQYSGNS